MQKEKSYYTPKNSKPLNAALPFLYSSITLHSSLATTALLSYYVPDLNYLRQQNSINIVGKYLPNTSFLLISLLAHNQDNSML